MSKRRWYQSKYLFVLMLFVVVCTGLAAGRQFTVKADKPNCQLGTVDRGDIVTQAAATGTLAAVTTVAVGTQVSGTIVSRNVYRGQTVAASFSSPTLFTIGEDLTKMGSGQTSMRPMSESSRRE
jgi:multidrug efflux pump subunit AcrA (membrane-fusion protein)